MDRVYVVYHSYGDEEDIDENRKLIGYFSSPVLAQQAIDTVRTQPGFRDHPNGFEVLDEPVDTVGWDEGFISEDADAGG